MASSKRRIKTLFSSTEDIGASFSLPTRVLQEVAATASMMPPEGVSASTGDFFPTRSYISQDRWGARTRLPRCRA
jgi:hypothetical protein